MKRRSIFETYGSRPIKNVKTPIRHFDGDSEEELVEVPETTQVPVQDMYSTEIYPEDYYNALSHIRTLLLIIVILKVICLLRK